jgi:hypothetical protein
MVSPSVNSKCSKRQIICRSLQRRFETASAETGRKRYY